MIKLDSILKSRGSFRMDWLDLLAVQGTLKWSKLEKKRKKDENAEKYSTNERAKKKLTTPSNQRRKK